MTKLRVLDGQRFGRLTVVSRGGKTGSGGYKWNVRCDCGAEKEIASDHLVRDVQPVVSCGCFRNDQVRNLSNPDDTAFNLLLGSYKKRARLKGRDFLLSQSEFKALTQNRCHYCGQEPKTVSYNRPRSGRFVHNGVDRVDPLLGYVSGNCVPCCKLCNYMKLALTRDDFLDHILVIASFQLGGGNG